MASFDEHIKQSQRNLDFLCSINKHCNHNWDWQTTVSFYIGVHLINSHIARTANQHYRSHEQVDNAINPYNSLSVCKLQEKEYKAYRKLQMLSRRSRYLISDDIKNRSDTAFFTSEKHFAKAIRQLDSLMSFFSNSYGVAFEKNNIQCSRISQNTLLY